MSCEPDSRPVIRARELGVLHGLDLALDVIREETISAQSVEPQAIRIAQMAAVGRVWALVKTLRDDREKIALKDQAASEPNEIDT